MLNQIESKELQLEHAMVIQKTKAKKSHIIPYPNTVSIVKRIFKVCAEGIGPYQIAKILTAEKVFTPTAYEYHQNGILFNKSAIESPYKWHSNPIINILDNIIYKGYTINHKTER